MMYFRVGERGEMLNGTTRDRQSKEIEVYVFEVCRGCELRWRACSSVNILLLLYSMSPQDSDDVTDVSGSH